MTMRLKQHIMAALAFVLVCAGGAYAQQEWRFTLWDVAAEQEQSIADAVPDLALARIVYAGESHDQLSHHLGQLEVIRALRRAGHDIAVGLEMFERREQESLDAWLAGDMDERAFMSVFRRNWGDMWPLYRAIFVYCRDESIPMVGLNVPRSVTRKVAREGFESLTQDEIGMLPPIACNVTPQYEAFLRRVVGAHGRDESEFRRFCEAQLVWDTAMAVHALEYLENHPATSMVVLTGAVHAWRPAMPLQVWRQKPSTAQRIILPRIEGRLDIGAVDTEDCDYLMFGVEE